MPLGRPRSKYLVGPNAATTAIRAAAYPTAMLLPFGSHEWRLQLPHSREPTRCTQEFGPPSLLVLTTEVAPERPLSLAQFGGHFFYRLLAPSLTEPTTYKKRNDYASFSVRIATFSTFSIQTFIKSNTLLWVTIT